MITKTQINAALKTHNIGFVKLDQELHSNGTNYKNCHGKSVKGIYGASGSPTHVTDQHITRAIKCQTLVERTLRELGMVTDTTSSYDVLIANPGTNKEIRIELTRQTFPKHSASHYYGQSGYTNIYIVPVYL